MTLTDPMIITYDYVCAALFGVAFLFYAITAFHYSLTGRERISGVSKAGFLVFVIAMLAALFDAGANTFFYIRPSDTVKVFWFRQSISVFIMPLLFLGFFELLHNPHEKVSETTPSKHHKKGNMEYVYCLTKWTIFCFSLGSEAFILPATISDNSSVRWASLAINALGGVISFSLVYYYLRTHGMRMFHKNSTIIKYYFFNKKTNAILALVAWMLILCYWITREFLLGFGYALANFITYDQEVTGYLSIQVILGIAVFLACLAARKTHVVMESVTVMVVEADR
jgi:hypothetical protein